MNRKTTRIERVAYHEAGHCVADWVHRHTIASVTIFPDGDVLGRATVSRLPLRLRSYDACEVDGRTMRLFEGWIDAFYAGPAAEAAVIGRRPSRNSMAHDQYCARSLAECVLGIDNRSLIDAFLAYRWECARCFVADLVNWQFIDALAKELLVCRTMTGKQVRSFLRSCLRPLDTDEHSRG